MKRAYASALIGAATAALAPAAAHAECEPRFLESAQSIVVPELKINAGGQTTETFGIRIRNEGSAGGQCTGTLRFARSNTAPVTLPTAYSILTGGRTLEVLPNENVPGTAGSDYQTTQIPTGPNGANWPFRLVIPTGWGMPVGSWTEDLIVYLLDDTGNVVDQLFLTITFTVPPAVELRIVGVTGQNAIASIDLGELDPLSNNDSAPFGVRIWSTSAYTVSFDSQNEGRLIHANATDAIEYKLYMDGVAVNVAGAAAKHVPHGTDSLGELHPLKVRVEPFRAKAGDYSDRVEVTVTAS